MKFEIGKTYYGVDPGKKANWREITAIAFEGDQVAVRVVDIDGDAGLSVWNVQNHSIFTGWAEGLYRDTPWHPEFKVGDRVTFEWQTPNISHYLLREKFAHKNPHDGLDSQWIALRIYKDGTTRLALLNGDFLDAVPYKK